jgi:PAS domain S-box-containing protein
MPNTTNDIEGMLDPILRGAAVVLGCNSANLIVYHPKSGKVSVQVGVASEQTALIEEIEGMLGLPLRGVVFEVPDAGGSLLLGSWPYPELRETSSLAEIVGSILPEEIIAPVEEIIGPRRFVIVPVVHGERTFGVMIFEKNTKTPFSVQQREIILRYAQRVGELLDIDMGERAHPLLDPESTTDLSVRHQLLRLALGEGAPALTVDTEFRITSCNEATRTSLGYEPGALLQQDIATLFQDPAEIRSILNQQFLFLSDGHHEEEIVVQRKDGTVFAAAVKALLLADGEQNAIGYLVMIRHRAAPRDGQPGNVDRLIRRERLATMGELAAQLAHEIRNPLLSIGATLESLAKDAADDETGETLRLLTDEVNRLDLILKDYMSLATRCNASVAPVDLARLLDEVARLQLPLQRERDARITLQFPEDVIVHGDAEGLRQVFFNLLQNALEVSAPGAEVICRAEHGPRHLSILVEDQGPGLPDTPARLFEPFHTTKKNGTGLGLTVSQRIVEAHGGTITLSPRSGGGCRVIVALPLRDLG